MPHERMYRKILNNGAMFFPCIRKETTSKGNEFQNIRLINLVHHEKHSINPVTRL
jgi:hypothetical protein